jgi:hypothetical protein
MLTIIEKYLDQVEGHHHTQIKAIESLSQRSDIKVLTAKNSGMVLQKISNIDCILSTREDRHKYPNNTIEHDIAVLEKNFREQKSFRNTSILIPSAEEHDFRVCIRLLTRNPNIAKFSLRVLNCRVIDSLSDAERRELTKCVQAGTITILTETISLSELLKIKYNLIAKNLLLLPCTVNASDTKNSRAHSMKNPRAHFKVGYLGGFRKEKGAEKLPIILTGLKKILNAYEDKVSIEFIMPKARFKSKLKLFIYNFRLIRSLRNSVKADRQIKLTYLENDLSPDLFVETIRSLDLLLIPYNLEKYHARGSGIIIDGVLAEKPIVYTQGIGMNEFLSFGNSEAALNVKDFAPKIIKMIRNLAEYQSNTAKARKALFAEIKRTSDFLRGI